MPRLRRSNPGAAGITRRRRGRGWEYRTADGFPVDPDAKARIDALVLPPAWQQVWISPHPNGHIQAIGVDAAGRKQYRYHDDWRTRRDREKFERVLGLAECLPALRADLADKLAGRGLSRDRVLACALRLLDLGFFRIGGEEYAEGNGTFGLATIRREHVSVEKDAVVFEYPAKHSIQREQSIVDPDVLAVVKALLKRPDPSPELLAWWDGPPARRWVDVRSGEINDFVQDETGGKYTAKDFRTWHATVLMAVALAVSEPASRTVTARKRAISRAYQEVSHYLGNTPAVARASYVDPRVVDLYQGGTVIDLTDLGEGDGPATHGAVEKAVLELLRD